MDNQFVTEQERREFGDDLIDVVGRRAREVLLPEVRQLLQGELQPIRQAVAQTEAEAARQLQAEVYRMLNAQVPGWEAINTAPEFLAWLEMPGEISGTARHTGLAQAFNTGDAPRVVGIFQQFQRESGTVSTPSGARGSTRRTGARIWSEREIKDFYDRARRKLVAPDEYQRTSAELAAAAREGRIRPDRIEPT
jgi:hypothetical protein